MRIAKKAILKKLWIYINFEKKNMNLNKNKDVVRGLIKMLDETNELVKIFRSAKQRLADDSSPNYTLSLLGRETMTQGNMMNHQQIILVVWLLSLLGVFILNVTLLFKVILILCREYRSCTPSLWLFSILFCFFMTKMVIDATSCLQITSTKLRGNAKGFQWELIMLI